MQRCPHCDSKVKKNTKFCPECGMTVIWEDNAQAHDRKNRKRKLTIVVITMLVIASIAAFLSLGGFDWINNTAVQIVPETTVSQIAFSDDPTAISAASQSVVKLNCYDKNGDLYSTGSGFACFTNDIIVTNYHVIEGNAYSIEASTETGDSFKIRYVLVADKAKDIAILMTSLPHNLPLLVPNNGEIIQKGEKVVAIGSPLGLLNSVSAGVFSGYVDDGDMDIIQFTASISNGSSGGALFNDAGEVIGITFASYELGQNLNLAIPIKYVEELLMKMETSDRVTLEAFYETHIPTYTVDQVIGLGDKLADEVFYLEGYLDSHGVVYQDDGTNWKTLWCDVYSDIKDGMCVGNGVRISHTVVYPAKMPYDLIKGKVRLERLSPGAYARFRCEYKAGTFELTLISVENIK